MGHSYEVDWWALAILMHEVLTGHSPFLTSTKEVVTQEAHKLRILQNEPVFENLLELPEAIIISDFLRQLLVKDADQRLGISFSNKKYFVARF